MDENFLKSLENIVGSDGIVRDSVELSTMNRMVWLSSGKSLV